MFFRKIVFRFLTIYLKLDFSNELNLFVLIIILFSATLNDISFFSTTLDAVIGLNSIKKINVILPHWQIIDISGFPLFSLWLFIIWSISQSNISENAINSLIQCLNKLLKAVKEKNFKSL